MRKHLLFLALAAAMLLPIGARAQELGDYILNVSQGTYTSIASSNTLLSHCKNDSDTAGVVMPFSFPFGDTVFAQGQILRVRPDGFVYFWNTGTVYHNPATSMGYNNIGQIAPFFIGDGKLPSTPSVTQGAFSTVETLDDGRQAVVIEYKGLQCYYSPYGNYNYQIRLYSDGSISATIGGEINASTYSSVRHNFIIDNGYDHVCLDGSWTSPMLMTPTATADIVNLGTTLPAEGTTITFTRPANFCPKVYNLAIADGTITPDGATINWSSLGTESEWAVYLNGEFHATASDSTYTLTGLNANTAYTVGVRAVCGAGDTSNPRYIVLRTACADITEPYFRDGFESYVTGSGNFPTCWHKMKATYTPGTYPYTYASGIEGSQSLFWATNTATDTVIVCTGSIPLSADAMHVAFWMGTSAITEVGVLTDTADLASFVPFRSITNQNYWNQYDIYTDTIEGLPSTGEVFLAFRTIGAGNTSLDDVLAEPSAGVCRRPVDGQIASVTHNSITLSWTADEANAGATYDVLLSRHNTTDENDSTAVLTSGIADLGVTLDELLPYTTYYAWVRTNCGGGVSEWYRLGGVTTYRTCYPLSGLSVDNVNYSSALVSWTYTGAGRGLPESGVHVILRDDSTILRQWDVPYSEGSSTFVTGLSASTSYTVELRTLCDPDSANAASVVAFTTASCGSVSGTPYTSNSYVPFNRYYDYGISQTLYPASAASALSGGITGIAFSSIQDRDYTYTVDVYMGETDQQTLTTSTAIPLSQLTLVATDVQMTSHAGFNAINFSTPYVLTGAGSNLVVMVVNKTGDYDGTGYYWTSHSVGSNVAIYSYRDNTPYTPASATYSSSVTYRPDIQFLGECNLECLAPNLALVGVGETSADLRWARGLDESSWAVQYKADSVWISADAATDTLATIEGLSPRTGYSFRVGTVCDEDTLWSNTVSAYTLCEPLAELPFAEGFENMPNGTGTEPLCWQFVKTSTSSSDNHYVSTSSPHSGTQCMYFYPYSYQYLISPAMPAGTDPADLEISFWGKISNSGSSRIEVGLMTDPSDLNSFRQLTFFAGNGGTWTEYTVYTDTTTLTANDQFHVVFRVYCSNGYGNFIDDISIGTAQCRRPRNLQASAITDASATISWAGMDGATYEYYYGQADSIPADAALLTTEEASVSLSGLAPATGYTFWVRTVCGDDVTAWSAPLAFRTACGVVSAPWMETFDTWGTTFDQCWTRYSGEWQDSGAISLTPSTGGWYVNSGSYGDYITLQGKALCANLYSTNKYWFVTPAIGIEGTIALSFDIAVARWSASVNNFDANDRFIVAVTADSGATWTPVYMLGADATRDDGTLTELTNSYTSISVPLAGFDGQTIQLGFYEASLASGGDNRIVIDNIALQSAECLRPSHVRVNTETESAVVTWSDYSTDNNSGYEFILSPSNSMTDTAATTYTLSVGDTSVSLTGLTPNTTYYYFLRSTCEENPTANSWVRGEFRTPCLIEGLPFIYDFEGIPSGSGTEPECWTYAENVTSSSSSHYVSTTSPHGGTQCMYFYPYGYEYLISPAMPAGTNPAELEITFWGKINSSGSSRIEVGLMTDPNDLTTFRPMSNHGSNSSTWTEYNVYTDTTTLTAEQTVYVAFRVYCSSGWSNYIDDISIANAGCRRPASLSVTDVSPYTASLEWPAVTGASSYRLVYSTTVDSTVVTDSVDVDGTPATIADLQPGTTYTVTVQTLCADGGISDPRGPASFTTELTCYPITNLRLTGKTLTSASVMWDNDSRGNDATGALVVLRDNTDSTSTDTMATDGVNYHFFTSLDNTHSYTATFFTLCDADTATGLSINIEFDPCGTISGEDNVSRIPFNGNWNYGYTQTLYPRSTVGTMTELSGLEWYVNSTPSSYPTRTVDVYIGTTSATTLDYNSPLPLASMTKVVTGGSLNVSQTGWTGVTFDSIWALPDSGTNIVVAVVNLTGSYSSFNWRGHSGIGISGYQDDTMTDYTNMSAYSNKYNDNTVADIHFVGEGCELDPDACMAPGIAVTAVDSASATVVWMGNAETYVVQYRNAVEAAWAEAAESTSPVVLSDLQPGSFYMARVGAVCAEGDTLFSNIIGFNTDCAQQHLPYHFGQAELQAASAAGGLLCFDWQSFYRSSSNGNYYVYTSSTGAWFALPEIAEPLSGAQVRTKVAATSSSATSMQVGVMESDGTITWVETVALPHANSSSDVTEHVIYLDSYTGTGNRVVIGSTGSNYMYFHEINVEPLDACRMVSNVAVSDVSESSATVSWTPVAGQTQWIVYLDGQELGMATDSTYLLSGLSSSTGYTVGIRAYCGGTDTARMVTTTFRTACGSITDLPWYEDFEAVGAELHTSYPNAMTGGIMPCWDFTPSGSAAHMSFAYNSTYTYGGNSAGYSLCFYPGVIGGNNIVALPVFAENISGLKMSYVTRPEGTSSSPGVFDVGYVTNVADSSSFVSVKHYSYSDFNGAYILDTVVFTNAPAGARIAFRHKANASNWYWFVDSIVVDHNSSTPGPGPQPGDPCNAPTGLTLVSHDRTTATVSWTAGGNETAWELQLDNGQELVSANATTYTFTDLEPGSDHSVRVRAVCSETSHSGWSAALQFSTLGIADVEAALGISLYPNPASSVVAVEANEAVSLNIIDQSGRVVYSSESEATKHSVDVSQMAKGAYYVRLTGQSGTAVRKLVVK